jgi:hypothetical protein
MRNELAGLGISETSLHPLDDVQVIDDVLKAAVIR